MIYIFNPRLSDNEISEFRVGTYRFGPEIWTLNTFYYLKDIYSEIRLVNKLPEEGIIISHNDYLDKVKPTKKHYFVSLQADRRMSKNAHVVIVQNKDQLWQRIFFHKCYFIRHWPEKDIIKRDKERKNLKSIKYIGNLDNLDPYFQTEDWLRFCNSNNIDWEIVIDRTKWSDFSQVDLIIAVRSFKKKLIKQKPSTKLFNAWKANVPIIVGSNETAYFYEGKSKYDFISVEDIDELKNILKKLISNNDEYENYVSLSKRNEELVTFENISNDWIEILKLIEEDSKSYFKSKIKRFKIELSLRFKNIIK